MNKALRILILDNNREKKSFGSRSLVQWTLRTAPLGSEILVRRAPDFDLPKSEKFGAMIVSGSITSSLENVEPWIKPFDEFLVEKIEKGLPILGVCYGHQSLARCLFKMNGLAPKLGIAKEGEFGWETIQKIGESALLEGLKKQFISFQSHYEELLELPPGTRCFAQTERCSIQAFELEDKPIFGIQFHPEYSIEEGEASLEAKIKSGVRRDWILNPGKGPKLYDKTVGNTIFGNFFKIADQYRSS